MNCYWWRGNGQPNFGDELGPLLLENFASIQTGWTGPALAEIITTGSILDVLPQSGWPGIVAGSGKLQITTHTDLTNADVLAVRGPLTANAIKMRRYDRRNVVIGDPALLVDEIVSVGVKEHGLGLIAHWSDTDRTLYKKYAHLNPFEILATDDPVTVIAQISSCERLISSTLHGVIVADALAIPRQPEQFPRINHPWEGGEFKWCDYFASINQSLQWGQMYAAHVPTVERMKFELYEMLRSIKDCHASS